jgi:predicted  nucleic acid-binding Zn-ribbon protein
MPVEQEKAELARRIARMQVLLRTIADERAMRAINDIIEEANRRLEALLEEGRKP